MINLRKITGRQLSDASRLKTGWGTGGNMFLSNPKFSTGVCLSRSVPAIWNLCWGNGWLCNGYLRL